MASSATSSRTRLAACGYRPHLLPRTSNPPSRFERSGNPAQGFYDIGIIVDPAGIALQELAFFARLSRLEQCSVLGLLEAFPGLHLRVILEHVGRNIPADSPNHA